MKCKKNPPKVMKLFAKVQRANINFNLLAVVRMMPDQFDTENIYRNRKDAFRD